MTKFLNNINFWYKNARPYSVPITFLSWLCAYTYSLTQGGNFIYGLIALVGISLVHLSTNLADDYFDYKRLTKDEKYLMSVKDIKCKYLKTGQATIDDLRNVIIILLFISSIAGGILFLTSGWYVFLFAVIALIIALSYSALSSRGFGDVAVILAYGPLMFEGVYYVMTSNLSLDILILSLGCAMIVNTILYAHMLMDYDEDVISGKTTLCTKLKTKNNALNFLLLFYFTGYIILACMAVKTENYFYLLPIITAIFVNDLYKKMQTYPQKDINIIFIKYPFINANSLLANKNAPFLLRFIYTRNIAVYFMLLVCLAIICGLVCKQM